MVKHAWVLVDKGKTGTEKQCIGLAQALGYVSVHISISFPKSVAWLPSKLLKSMAFLVDLPQQKPDIIISGGRQAASLAAALKQKLALPAIHVLNPYGHLKLFDWVIMPKHDNKTAPNILTMTGAMHDLTLHQLEKTKQDFLPFFQALPRPYTVVSVGGKNKTHTFTKKELNTLLESLDTITGSLLVSVSRRTPPDFIPVIQTYLKHKPHFLWYEGCPYPNPYKAYLAMGDSFILTSDSVSMIMDVVFTGKPLKLFHLPTGSKKFKRFYHDLKTRGVFKENYTPLDEKKRMASLIQASFQKSF